MLVALQAIQKGSIDSCREAHQDWLVKVQATLAAPAHVQTPTPYTLASLHSLHPASFPGSAQVTPCALPLWPCALHHLSVHPLCTPLLGGACSQPYACTPSMHAVNDVGVCSPCLNPVCVRRATTALN